MKVLVTGATGFVGSHLCEKLNENNHQVFCLVRNKEKFKYFKVPGIPVLGDLSTNKPNDWIESLPNDLDACVHIAGLLHSFDREKFYEVNAGAVENFTKDLSRKYPNLKFILLSSLSARGPNSIPASHYGRSKLAGEEALIKSSPHGWQNFIFRAPVVIGPRDPGILDLFKMVKSRLVLYPGSSGANNTYSFISVFDLVSVISRVLELPKIKNGIFYPSFYSFKYKDLVLEIKRILGIKRLIHLQVPISLISFLSRVFHLLYKVKIFDFKLTPDKVLDIKCHEWVCNWQQSKPFFEYDFKWGLSDTLQETFKDYKQRNWI